MHQSPHTEDTEVIVGAKVVQLNEFVDGESESGVGGGIFGETSLIPGWAEIELSVVVARVEETTVVPVDSF